jgi:hypothetical protein
MPAVTVPTLYHYTSIHGLLGIVESKVIWATQVQYLNDMHEVRDASLLAHSLVGSVFRNRGSAEFRKMLLNMLENFGGPRSVVVSFSENGDQLSQWRSYCAEGGVSIGFDRKQIEGLLAENRGFALARCIYSKREKKLAIQPILESAFKRCEELGEPYSYKKQCDIQRTFYPKFLAASLTMKNETFSEERECV